MSEAHATTSDQVEVFIKGEMHFNWDPAGRRKQKFWKKDLRTAPYAVLLDSALRTV